MSVADFKDAYHTLRFATDSKKYSWIMPLCGSPTHFYLRPGIVLSVLDKGLKTSQKGRDINLSWMTP